MNVVIKPKLLEARDKKPKSMFDLCAKLGLEPDQVHTVRAWIKELGLPLTDIVTHLSSRARKMLSTRYGLTPDASTSITTGTTTSATGTETKKTKKFK